LTTGINNNESIIDLAVDRVDDDDDGGLRRTEFPLQALVARAGRMTLNSDGGSVDRNPSPKSTSQDLPIRSGVWFFDDLQSFVAAASYVPNVHVGLVHDRGVACGHERLHDFASGIGHRCSRSPEKNIVLPTDASASTMMTKIVSINVTPGRDGQQPKRDGRLRSIGPADDIKRYSWKKRKKVRGHAVG
jgi:hypothetical protein